MRKLSVAAAFLFLGSGCTATHGDDAVDGGSAPGLSVQEGGYVPGTTACPAFACLSGVHVLLDYPLSYEQTLESVVTICRNDTCFELKLPPSAQPPEGVGTTGPYLQVVERHGSQQLTSNLSNDLHNRLFLEFRWFGSRPQDLRDGDRYRAKVVDATRTSHELLDEQIDYRDTSIGRPGAPCYQECKSADLDRRRSEP